YDRLGRPGVALHLIRQTLQRSHQIDQASRRQLLEAAGYLYAHAQDWKAAADAFTAALAVRQDAETLIALATAHRMSGNPDEAVRTLDHVVAASLPPDARVRYLDERAAALSARGEDVAARDMLAEAQRQQPSAARSYDL